MKLEEKLSGIVIDNRLTLEPNTKNLCKKLGLKLHALARIVNNKKCSIMKAFVLSQFLYCLLIQMFHTRKLKAWVLYYFYILPRENISQNMKNAFSVDEIFIFLHFFLFFPVSRLYYTDQLTKFQYIRPTFLLKVLKNMFLNSCLAN